MNIKQIVDKILKEADISGTRYTVADRIDDVNAEMQKLITYATQLGSKFPMTDGTTAYEDFTLVAGDNTFTRTKPDISIIKVEYRQDENTEWQCLDRDTQLCERCFAYLSMRFRADEKTVTVSDALVGEIRVTYERPTITLFTESDYTDPTPPSPTWIPSEFHPLLYLKPALDQARLYKPDRVEKIKADRDEYIELFDAHYRRNATVYATIQSEDTPNYR